MSNIQDLIDRCSGKFVAKSALDFVGAASTAHGAGARAVARHLEHLVTQAQAAETVLADGSFIRGGERRSGKRRLDPTT